MESLPPSHKFATGLDVGWGGTEEEDVELLRGNGSVVLRKVENQMGMNPIPIEQLEKKEEEEREGGGKEGRRKERRNISNQSRKAVRKLGE